MNYDRPTIDELFTKENFRDYLSIKLKRSMEGDDDCNLCKTFRKPKGDTGPCLFPLIADSTFFGPSIDETIIYLLSLLPKSWLDKISPFHLCESSDEKGPCAVDLNKWLKTEYMALSKEVSNCGWYVCETNANRNRDLLESRKFVLNRLAELMEKKAELESSHNLHLQKQC